MLNVQLCRPSIDPIGILRNRDNILWCTVPTNNSGIVRHYLTLCALQDQFSRGHANYWRVQPKRPGFPRAWLDVAKMAPSATIFGYEATRQQKNKQRKTLNVAVEAGFRLSNDKRDCELNGIHQSFDEAKISAIKTNVEVISSQRGKQLTREEEHLLLIPLVFHFPLG